MLLASRNSFIMMRFFQQQETMPPHLPWLINFRNFSWWGSMMSWVHPRLRGWWGNIWLVWPQHSQSPTTLAQVPAPGSDRTQWWRGPYEAALSQQLIRDRWEWPGGRGAALQQTVYTWPATNQRRVFHCIDQWESSITDLATVTVEAGSDTGHHDGGGEEQERGNNTDQDDQRMVEVRPEPGINHNQSTFNKILSLTWHQAQRSLCPPGTSQSVWWGQYRSEEPCHHHQQCCQTLRSSEAPVPPLQLRPGETEEWGASEAVIQNTWRLGSREEERLCRDTTSRIL